MNKKIIFTGGSGRFAESFKKTKSSYDFYYPNSKILDILSVKSIEKYIKKIKPKIFIHAAGLSRPMAIHVKNISKSIDHNIIGTSNVTKVCKKYNIKLVYFSTCYVYPGISGNYNEKDSLFPINNYAWSKLGGECAVQMYSNSLILRLSMTEKPFIHKKAFVDFKTNFIFHDEVAKILIKLLPYKGIVNVGGKSQSVYKFAIKENDKIKKSFAKKILAKNMPLNPSMNVNKLKKILKK
jgi:dTDP-4-dehydrorhamnose reductase